MFTFAENGFMYNTGVEHCDSGDIKPKHRPILQTVNHHILVTKHNNLQMCPTSVMM